MGGLWKAEGVPCTAAGFKIKAETPKSCHGKWRSLEQRSESEVLGDIKQGWRSEKIIISQFHSSDMYSPGSPSTLIPIANNVPIDVDSDAEAEQVALELAQAQEQLCATKEDQEKHREEWKRQEEERKAKTMVAIKLAAEQAAELVVDREQRIQLQVSLSFVIGFLLEIDFSIAGLGGVSNDTGNIDHP